MDWKVLLTEIFEICIIPLLGILTTFLVALIKTKMKEIQDNTDSALADKYLAMLTDTISACVLATNQTYVNSLKDKDLFDADA
jgi:ABC-type sulfate transport system substrate-binding protein